MITKINRVGGCDGWWMDIDTSRHACYNHAMFKTYINVEDKKVMLGDAHTINVVGIRDMQLNFTIEKTLILKYVMHVLYIRKNLVFGFLLNKAGCSRSIEADLYTISKNDIFLRNNTLLMVYLSWMLKWIKKIIVFTPCVILMFGVLDFVMLINALFLI